MKRLMLLISIAVALASAGCVSLLDEKDRARVAAGVMEKAYDDGGASLVACSVDAMVLSGKLTPAQGDLVKRAMQSVYDQVLDDLRAKAAEPPVVME